MATRPKVSGGTCLTAPAALPWVRLAAAARATPLERSGGRARGVIKPARSQPQRPRADAPRARRPSRCPAAGGLRARSAGRNPGCAWGHHADRLLPQAARAKLPVSIKEYLTLLEAIKASVIGPSIDEFYYLSRTALVKDEANFDKFDRAFAAFFKGVELLAGISQEIPLEWLLKQVELELSAEEKAEIAAMGWDKLMETLKKRLEEQKGRHEGGSKWIGTGGTSPFGAYGYNPEGIRIGQDKGRNRSAVKVWDQREYRDYDDSVELGTRNIKVALRRLRNFAREGADLELDLDDTIH